MTAQGHALGGLDLGDARAERTFIAGIDYVGFAPLADMPHHLLFAGAISRAQSMKSCATLPSVRFFNVTIPVGTSAIGS